MKSLILNFISDEDGMSMAEYGIMLGVVVTVGATIFTILSTRLSTVFSKASTAIPT